MIDKTNRIIDKLQKDLRTKAEALLERSESTQEAFQDMEKLLHELHVHQIELAMQNEELRRAHSELEISRDHYAELYDFAPVGYFTVNSDGIIVECNLTGADLFGMERKTLSRQPFARFLVDEEKDRWYLFCRQANQECAKQQFDTKIRRADGSRIDVRLECVRMIVDSLPPVIRFALTDITAIKEAEQALRIAAVAFETQEGIIVTDANKFILRANQAFSRITGYSIEECIGQLPSFLQSGYHDQKFYENLWTTVVRDGFWQGEIWDKRKDGEIIPIF